jgi:aspartate 1-decarboxylase
MWRQMLKSKIHRATVTGANIEYEGSITIDRDLLEAADMMMDEKVLVVNLTNGSRIESYAIPAERGSGTICLNGGAAKHGKVGDLLIIMSFGVLDEVEIKTHVPKLVKVDAKNRIITEDAKLRKAAR